MAIFLKNSWNVPPVRWGSPADVQYAVKVNAEVVYGMDADSCALSIPWFWGFPLLDYFLKDSIITNNGTIYKNSVVDFGGTSEYAVTPSRTLWDWATYNGYTILWSGNTHTHKNAALQGTINIGKMVHNTATQYWSFGTIASGVLQFYYYSGGAQVVNGITVLPTNVELNLSMTSDGTDIEIFCEGKSHAKAGIVGSPATDGATPLTFGACKSTYFDGTKTMCNIFTSKADLAQINLFNEIPYGLYRKVIRPFYLLPIAPGPATKFYDLNAEISGGSESTQDLITDIRVNAESFFDLETEISATTVQTILDLDTEIAADYNISFEDLVTDIQAVAKSLIDLNTDISATTQPEIIIDLNTDIQAASGDVFCDLDTDIQVKDYQFYDLNTEISVIRSKYWLDTEIEALSYARWSFNTEWNPNRFLSTEIAAKKPYTFNFKTKTGSSYVASSSEIELLLSGYSWPLRTLFLDYLRVGTSNIYNFELWWARGQSGKNPLKNAKIKAEYTNTQYGGGYEVVTCDWLSYTIDGGTPQTINATPTDLGDLPCDSKLDIELTVDCRDCSLTRGLVFFRLIITGDYKEAIYGAPVVYGDGTQYFEGEQDDYQSNNFVCRLYVV